MIKYRWSKSLTGSERAHLMLADSIEDTLTLLDRTGLTRDRLAKTSDGNDDKCRCLAPART